VEPTKLAIKRYEELSKYLKKAVKANWFSLKEIKKPLLLRAFLIERHWFRR
jgi:hypothetical protein